MAQACQLENRSLLRLSGEDCSTFLQRLVSNDLRLLDRQPALYAALLTPQGKFLHDLFIIKDGPTLLLDIESARADDFIRRLMTYKMRAKIALEPLAETHAIWALWENVTDGYADPRLPDLGRRLILPKGEKPATEIVAFAAYDRLRLSLGIGDGSRDLEIEKTTLAEGNLDLLNGVSWDKGCYVGQEVTARMHFRAAAKKRLFPVRLSASLPPGTPVFKGETECGQIRSGNGEMALALLPVDQVAPDAAFRAGNTEISMIWPHWMPQKG